MKIINKKDYDISFKFDDKNIKCYSEKKIKELYPSGNYKIIGETKKNNKKNEINKITLADKELIVSKYKSNNKIGYKRKYFVAVGEDEYICLLKSNLFIFILSFLIIGTVVSATIGISTFLTTPTLTPDYPLPEEDKQAVKIEGDNTQKVENQKGGGSVRVRLSNTVKVNLTTGIATMVYQNPNQSTENSVITLVLINNGNEYYIGRSGLIKPGNQITELELNTNNINLTEGVYKGKYIVDHYNPKTGEKALTNSNFEDIEIQVSR